MVIQEDLPIAQLGEIDLNPSLAKRRKRTYRAALTLPSNFQQVLAGGLRVRTGRC